MCLVVYSHGGSHRCWSYMELFGYHKSLLCEFYDSPIRVADQHLSSRPMLLERWQVCILRKRDYIEGLYCNFSLKINFFVFVSNCAKQPSYKIQFLHFSPVSTFQNFHKNFIKFLHHVSATEFSSNCC